MKRCFHLAMTLSVASVMLQGPQSAFAQRAPIDGDGIDMIAAFCADNWNGNFSSEEACGLWESQHYVPPAGGDPTGGSHTIPLPNGSYVTYHYTLGG